MNITANMPKIVAAIPGIKPKKYNAAITIATENLIILSVLPMFFFI